MYFFLISLWCILGIDSARWLSSVSSNNSLVPIYTLCKCGGERLSQHNDPDQQSSQDLSILCANNTRYRLQKCPILRCSRTCHKIFDICRQFRLCVTQAKLPVMSQSKCTSFQYAVACKDRLCRWGFNPCQNHIPKQNAGLIAGQTFTTKTLCSC